MSEGGKWLKVDECGTWRTHIINLDNILFIRQPELTDRNDIVEIAIKDFGTLKAYGKIEEIEEVLK